MSLQSLRSLAHWPAWLISWTFVISPVCQASMLNPNPNEESPVAYLPMFASFFLPGFGQYVDGEYEYGLAYSSVALLGLSYASAHTTKLGSTDEERRERTESFSQGNADPKDNHLRGIMVGLQTYQSMGGLSLYDNFRTRSQRWRDQYGRYTFIEKQSSMTEVLSAPFQMEHLSKASTLIPLGIVALISLLPELADSQTLAENNLIRTRLTGSDFAYSGAISYNAGTHEEAVFRGTFMPIAYDLIEDETWANASVATVFALLHLGPQNSFPLIQAAVGYYLGHVTLRNRWDIQEAVFIHTWWDVIAFLGAYRTIKNPESLVLHLPALNFFF